MDRWTIAELVAVDVIIIYPLAPSLGLNARQAKEPAAREEAQKNATIHTHTHTLYIYIYIYIYKRGTPADANLFRTQTGGYSGHHRVHEQFTSQTAKCVAHCVWAKTTKGLAKWHKTRGCAERYAFAGERTVCNSCSKCRKENQELLFAFRFQQLLQVRAAPPRRSNAGAWGELFHLGFDSGRRKLRLSWNVLGVLTIADGDLVTKQVGWQF